MMELQLSLMPLNKSKWQLYSGTAVGSSIISFFVRNLLNSITYILDEENIIGVIFTEKIYVPDKIRPLAAITNCTHGKRKFSKFVSIVGKPAQQYIIEMLVISSTT